jgi:hypothetical protein
MEAKVSVRDERTKRTFWKALVEIEKVLDEKKTPTDKTKLAVIFAGIVARIYAAEIHEEGLLLMMKRQDKKLLDE